MYRQHCAHAHSSFLDVCVVDLASVSMGIACYTRGTSVVWQADSDCHKCPRVFRTRHLISCHCIKSLFVPPGSRWSSEAQTKEWGKKEPPVLSFQIMLEVLGDVSLISLSPREPQWGGSAAWLLCYMLALIKGKYASLCRTLLFICVVPYRLLRNVLMS